MKKVESLEDFYKCKFDWLPENFHKEIGHVNHLNRAVKETTDKTTTQIIPDRILQESKVLRKHTSWNISEIA